MAKQKLPRIELPELKKEHSMAYNHVMECDKQRRSRPLCKKCFVHMGHLYTQCLEKEVIRVYQCPKCKEKIQISSKK